jgi:hypothetical protein
MHVMGSAQLVLDAEWIEAQGTPFLSIAGMLLTDNRIINKQRLRNSVFK